MRRGISAENTPNAKTMAPVANMPSHFSSVCPAITLLRGIDISASNPNFSDFKLATKAAVSTVGCVPLLPITVPFAVAMCA